MLGGLLNIFLRVYFWLFPQRYSTNKKGPEAPKRPRAKPRL